MYYDRVFKFLEEERVKYLVAGGMAVNLRGIPRFTQDLDILVDLSPVNLKRLKAALIKLEYRPRVPVPLEEFLNIDNWRKWKKEKGLKALNLYNPKVVFEQIDILTDVPISYSQARKNCVVIRAGGLRIRLVSISDLIRMKKKAGRDVDKLDIQDLKRIKRFQGAK